MSRYRIKNILMKADDLINNEEAEYLADCLMKSMYFDYSPEATHGLMVMCLGIGVLIGTLCH